MKTNIKPEWKTNKKWKYYSAKTRTISKKNIKQFNKKITKRMKLGIWISQEVLKVLDNPSQELFYENDCIADYKQKPYQLFVFLRVFGVKKTKGGNVYFYNNRLVEEVKGFTHKEVSKKLDKLIDKCKGEAPKDAPMDWIPEKWLLVKKAIKFFNLERKLKIS